MKKLMIFAWCMLISVGTLADQQAYWNLSAGWAQPGDGDIKSNDKTSGELEYDEGWIIEGALGVRYDSMPAAIEIALSYSDFDAEGEDVNQWTTMLNGLYFYDLSRDTETYLLGGIGIVSTEAEIGAEDISVEIGDTVFGGQLGAGITQAIDEECSINLEYKYLFADDFESVGIEVEQGCHSIQIGYTRMY